MENKFKEISNLKEKVYKLCTKKNANIVNFLSYKQIDKLKEVENHK